MHHPGADLAHPRINETEDGMLVLAPRQKRGESSTRVTLGCEVVSGSMATATHSVKRKPSQPLDDSSELSSPGNFYCQLLYVICRVIWDKCCVAYFLVSSDDSLRIRCRPKGLGDV